LINPGTRVLVYGYGNPGRQDDGLGVRLTSMLEGNVSDNVTLECNYQLNAEDALAVSDHDIVIFADAAINGEKPFTFTNMHPAYEVSFTTHAMKPESVLALCREIYNKCPLAFVLAIRGYEWELVEALTEKAERNLHMAHDFLAYFLSGSDYKQKKKCV